VTKEQRRGMIRWGGRKGGTKPAIKELSVQRVKGRKFIVRRQKLILNNEPASKLKKRRKKEDKPNFIAARRVKGPWERENEGERGWGKGGYSGIKPTEAREGWMNEV